MRRILPVMALALLTACNSPAEDMAATSAPATTSGAATASAPAASAPAASGSAASAPSRLWSAATPAEQQAWHEAAGTNPANDAPEIMAATLDFPGETQAVAYVNLRSDRPAAEVTLKSLSAELETRFPAGVPSDYVYQERWLVGSAVNSQCDTPQLRLLAMAGELPPREGQQWTGALGLLPDPEPCSGLGEAAAMSKSLRQEDLRLNEWNIIHSHELNGGEVAVATAVYPTDAALSLPAGSRPDDLILLEGQPGAPLSYGDLQLPALPDPHTSAATQ